jgi:hypothetical protein
MRVTERFCRLDIRRADILHFIKDGAHACRQFIDRRFSSDVHEVNLRLVEKEVIVQRSHFQTFIERHAHYRVHFILEENHIPHDHDPILRAWSEGCP